jgi:hypothetical protein
MPTREVLTISGMSTGCRAVRLNGLHECLCLPVTPENFLYTRQVFARGKACARFDVVDVVLRKLGRKGGRVVAGRLVRAPRSGSVVVIEFPDGLHEYVTTPVKRVLQLAGDDVFFVQTANSCYRLEVRSGHEVILDSVAK